MEYFFNADPGAGQAAALAVTSGAQVDLQAALASVDDLDPGFHTLHLRARSSDGTWGLPEARAFYLAEAPAAAEPTPIAALEYFFGDDPGYGEGVSLPVTNAATLIEVATLIPIADFEVGRYILSVRARNTDGAWGLPHSEEFLIQDLAGTVLVAPADGAGPLDLPVDFLWTAVSEADSYHLQVAPDSTFSFLAVDSTDIAGVELRLDESVLAYETTYHWRVRTSDGNRSGPWTKSRTFRTRSVIEEAPILTEPADSAQAVPIPTLLTWRSAAGAQTYTVEVARESSFAEAQRWDSLQVTELLIGTLQDTTTYFWRVTAQAGSNEPRRSGIGRFRTELRLPEAPPIMTGILVSHTDTTSLFRWNPILRATRYDLEISTDSTFTTSVRTVTGVADTTAEVAGLSGLTRHHWRVRGVNQRGPGAWSESLAFVTPVFTSMDGIVELPSKTSLTQNYPNPFNPSTVIGFQLSVSGNAKITVYDVLGRQVAVLVDEVMPAGSHTVNFDATNLTSGVYLYRLEAGGQVMTRKMLLMK